MERSLNIRVALVQGCFTCMTLVSTDFLSQVFERYGYDKATIGLIVALGCLACVFAQPLWGRLADKTNHPREIVFIACLIGGLLFTVLIYVGSNPLVSGICAVVMYMTSHSMMNLIDSWVSKLIVDGHGINYGATRSCGSITYAVMAVVFGQLVVHTGPHISPWMFFVFGALLAVSAAGVPNPAAVERKTEKKESLGSVIKMLASNGPYVTLMVSLFLYAICSNASGTYYPAVMFELGGDESHIGIGKFIQAMCEVPCLILFNRVRRRWNIPVNAVMCTSIFLYFLKTLGIALAPSIGWAIAIPALQGIAYALFLNGIVAYITENVDKRYISVAQMLLMSAGTSLGGIVGNALCGRIADLIGTQPMMIAMSFTGLLSFAIMMIVPRILAKKAQTAVR